jgi:hypothetical protein
MAQVKIRFSTILGDEHFAMLERRHGSWIDIDVGVELEMGDFDTARFEDRAQTCSGDTFAQTGHDTTGNENVFSHKKMRVREIPIIAEIFTPKENPCQMGDWTKSKNLIDMRYTKNDA